MTNDQETNRIKPIRIIDACMGRGKTSAAITYMEENRGSKRFLYITPYLDETERICEACDFDQPESDHRTKLADLKRLLHLGKNISSTHALFYLLDDAALELIREKEYNLILDESVEMIRKENISQKDFNLLKEKFVSVDDAGKVIWRDGTYEGRFSDYMEMAMSGSLFIRDGALMYVMRPDFLQSFNEIIMMTYMFDGQYQKAYLNFFGFEYKICGIDSKQRSNGSMEFKFSDLPDVPPNVDYHGLIHIIDEKKLNEIGDGRYALSKRWFERRAADSDDIKQLRANIRTFFQRRCGAASSDIIWTCFKGQHEKLIEKGRYRNSFLSLTLRATNKYKDKHVVAYLANRFVDPNIVKFFAEKGVYIDNDAYALSEMLQFIWRSAIRDGNQITVYIPSKRMRDLLVKWIEERNNGGES